jgi:hypothetical protein
MNRYCTPYTTSPYIYIKGDIHLSTTLTIYETCVVVGCRTILGKRIILENKAQIRKIQLAGKAARVEESAHKRGKHARYTCKKNEPC